jgi:hypothetical protein
VPQGQEISAILHAALDTLPKERQYALFAALPTLGELTHAIDTLAATPPGPPASQQPPR